MEIKIKELWTDLDMENTIKMKNDATRDVKKNTENLSKNNKIKF